MKTLVTLALILLFASTPVEVVPLPKGFQISKNVMFVVDMSGSMDTGEFSAAVGRVHTMAAQNVDEWNMAVIGFDSGVHRWPGVPEKDCPKDWARLPSAVAVRAATTWLEEIGTGGQTFGVAAFREALADPAEDLTVVVLTDGKFNGPGDRDLAQTIKKLQAARKAPAQFLFFSYGHRDPALVKLVKAVGGGLYHENDESEDE